MIRSSNLALDSEGIELLPKSFYPKQNSFLSLPIDIFKLLVSFFTPENFAHLSCCSRQAKYLDKEETLWKIMHNHSTLSEDVVKLLSSPKKQLELQTVKNMINIYNQNNIFYQKGNLSLEHYLRSGELKKQVISEKRFSTSISYVPVETIWIINASPVSLWRIGLFQDLTALEVSSGMTHIPNDIYTLKSLIKLNLSMNQISKISPKIRFLNQLHYLILNNNVLNQLPNSMGLLKNLQVIDLSRNRFQKFPQVLLQCRSLNQIAFSHNALKEIPESISLMTNLQSIDFEYNELEKIPCAICKLKLKTLFLSNNKIEEIPLSILTIESLRCYSFPSNSINSTAGATEALQLINYKARKERELKEEISRPWDPYIGL